MFLTYERKVLVGKKNEQRQQVMKTYGKIIYRKTLSLDDMAVQPQVAAVTPEVTTTKGISLPPAPP